MAVNVDNKKVFRGIGLVLLVFCARLSFGQKSQDDTHNLRDPNAARTDSIIIGKQFVTVAANQDLKPTATRNFFIGKNYRAEWIEAVKVPVLDLADANLKPIKEGGGKQTRSLKVEDKEGNEYSLRSIRKYPEKAIPEELRNTIGAKWVMDGISASYPYGGLSMPTFSEAANIPYFPLRLAYIGDDAALDSFRSKYKNTLALFENARPAGSVIQEKQADDKTYDTRELILELQKTNKNRIDQTEVLRARLLDNYVMDFDRHEGQWKWMKVKSASDSQVYLAVPKDHDQVFFTNQGLLPKIVKGILPELQGFKVKASDQVTFNRAAINFDSYFLNGLNDQQWRSTIQTFLASMTDSVIESALQKQPREIQHYAAEKIVKKLKKRRKNFSKDMMKYYHNLSKVVSVLGSNEDEIFQVVNSIDGHILVTVKGKNGNGIYERVFDPTVTKEIRLYGLEGKDQFNFEGSESKIRIRIIGGPGEDQVINNSTDKKVWVYDVNAENSVVKGTTEVKDRISADPMNNEYERLGHRFDESKFGVYSEYAFDGGFYAGAKYRITRHGFRKEPYAVQHEFILAHTFAVNSFLARYKGDFIKAIGNTDILVRGEYFGPTARTNFFGLGNETVFDQNKSGGIKYYRARYDLANLTVLAKSPIHSWMDVRVGPTFQYLQLRKEENEGRYISTLDHTVSDDNQLHEANFYGGAEAQLNINTKNNELLPTRGADFNSTVRYLIPLKGSSSNLTQLFSTLALYSDFLSKDKLVFATRFGFAHNVGNYQFAQAQYLGFRENLRGFRIHRFAGRTSAYNNVELRWKIADWKTPIVPAAIGLLAFNDVGRVWTENENSNVWHDGYGAGIWLAPMNKLVITGTLSYSKEEKNFALLTLGFQF